MLLTTPDGRHTILQRVQSHNARFGTRLEYRMNRSWLTKATTTQRSVMNVSENINGGPIKNTWRASESILANEKHLEQQQHARPT